MNSSNGMQTKVWGTPAWVFLHTIAFNFPLDPTSRQRHQYINFFKSMGNVLPCKECRICYSKMIAQGPHKLMYRVTRDRVTFAKWLYNVHNAINKRLKVKKNPTFGEVSKLYNSFRAINHSGIKKKSRLLVYPRKLNRGVSISVDSRCK